MRKLRTFLIFVLLSAFSFQLSAFLSGCAEIRPPSPEEIMRQPLGEQSTRLRILWGESPLSSIARFGRQAYPGLGEVTNQELFGWKSHSCCVNIESHGGDDLSGEQICGPEAKRMTAASK